MQSGTPGEWADEIIHLAVSLVCGWALYGIPRIARRSVQANRYCCAFGRRCPHQDGRSVGLRRSALQDGSRSAFRSGLAGAKAVVNWMPTKGRGSTSTAVKAEIADAKKG